MFARTVSFHLKPGRAGEFSRLLDQDIIPVLRKQKGFQDEISLVAAGGAEAVGISVWDLKEDADTYARSAYAGVLKALERVVEGTPQVQTYEVSNSTFHKNRCSRDCLKPTRLACRLPSSVARGGAVPPTECYQEKENHHDYRSLGFVP